MKKTKKSSLPSLNLINKCISKIKIANPSNSYIDSTLEPILLYYKRMYTRQHERC